MLTPLGPAELPLGSCGPGPWPDGHAAQKNGDCDRPGVDMCRISNTPVAAQRRRDGLFSGSRSREF